MGGARARRDRARRRRRRCRRRRAQHARRRGASGSSESNPAVPPRRSSPPGTPATTPPCMSSSRPACGPLISSHRFAHEYRAVARTASMTGLRAEGRLRATPAHGDGAGVGRDDDVRTHREELEMPLVRVRRSYRVAWTPALTFPGHAARRDARRAGCTHRRAAGRILARDGTVLAEGPPGNRTYPGRARRSRSSPGSPSAPEGPAIAARRKVGWPARAEVRPGRASRSRSTTPWAAFPACGWWRRRRRPGARAGSWPESRGGSRRTS